MSYNAGIPQPTDTLSNSQPSILTNFSQLDALFGVDHVKYSDPTIANRGRHLKVTFNGVAADPGLASPIASLYTKTVSGKSQLFFQNDTLAANIVQLTELPITQWTNGGSAGGTLSNYTIDTPWGMRIYVGKTNSKSGGPFAVTFPTALATAQYFWMVAPSNSDVRSANGVMQGGGTGLNIIYGGNATEATWIAMGKL